MNLETNYPDCLYNSHKNLNLGTVQLRYLDLRPPSLMTIFELERPAILAHNQLTKILASLDNDHNDDFSFKGLFVVAMAQFESMLNDLMMNMLRFYPQKLSLIKKLRLTSGHKVSGLGRNNCSMAK